MQINLKDFWHRFWRDKAGKVVIWQSPNIPLSAWLLFLVLAKIYPNGDLHEGLAFMSSAAIVTWAYLEIVSGKSYFRRLLGLIIMLFTIIGYFSA